MKIHQVEQGSQEWYDLRLGIPTASSFHKIITPKTRKFSSQARKYAFMLVAETLLKRPMESLEGLEWIERGKMLEDDARKHYEFSYEVKAQKVGFITTDDGKTGCSPDSLIDSDGMLEIKCPAPQTMVAYAIDGLDDEYICQKQGQLYVAEREWADLFAWHPEMQSVRLTVKRDESFIKELSAALRQFNDMKDEMMERVLADGFYAERERIRTVHEEAYKEYVHGVSGDQYMMAG